MNFRSLNLQSSPADKYELHETFVDLAPFAQRRSATPAHTASTNPKGHAPCKKP